MRLLAAFLLGCLCGGALMMPLLGTQLERAMLEQEHMMLTLIDFRSRLEKLSQQLATHQAPEMVESVDVVLRGVDDKAHSLALKRMLQPYTQELVGKELGVLDPYLIINVFDERLLSLDGTTYVLAVDALVIDRNIILLLEATRRRDDRSQ